MRLGVLGLALGLGWAAPAQATTVAAPLGGEPVALPQHQVVCSPEAELGGWTAHAQSTRVRPPPAGAEAASVTVHVAPSLAGCATQGTPLTLQAVAGWPSVDANSVVVSVDAGRIDVTGTHLRGTALRWRIGGHEGEDMCRDAQQVGAKQRCAFSVERELSAELEKMALTLLPIGVALDDQLVAFGPLGQRLSQASFTIAPAKVVLSALVAPEAALDVDAGGGRLPLRHPEAIDRVACRGAACQLEGRDLLVRGIRAWDEGLELRAVLRPHIYLQTVAELQSAPWVMVPLQRCPLTLASSPPLRGVAGQRMVVQVGGRCREDASLRFTVGGAPAEILSRHAEGDSVYVLLHSNAVLGDDVTITMQRMQAGAGSVRVDTRVVPSAHARIELTGFGAIDFIPSNRSAEIRLPSLGEGAALVPLPVAGVYSVAHDPNGGYQIQGNPGATGWVAVRLAYRDDALPPPLRLTNLAEFSDTVDRAVHAASIPIALGTSSLSDEPIVELQCTDVHGVAQRIVPAHPTNIAYATKDSCRLVLHRERLRPEDGDQLVRVTVNVSALDGVNRPEAAIDQRVLLRPGKEPRYLYLGGVIAPFDRVTARVAVVTEDLHESVAAIGQAERVNLAQVQWSLVVGNSRLRLYATTALPTGLFRVADKGHSGLMGLSSGILARLILLTSQGAQAPLGLELGVMVLGITGDTTPGPSGHVAAVAGLSLSVPIANVSRTTQAAISLHAWGEYEVSRAFMKDAGRPWGFVFGPSLSFGDVGVNL
jgi:hypothetical protein